MAVALATSTNAFFVTREGTSDFRALINVVVSGSYTTGGETLTTILSDNRIKVGNATTQQGTFLSGYAQGNMGNLWSISQVPGSSALKLQLWTSTPGTEFSAGAYNSAQTSDVIRLDLEWAKGGSINRSKV